MSANLDNGDGGGELFIRGWKAGLESKMIDLGWCAVKCWWSSIHLFEPEAGLGKRLVNRLGCMNGSIGFHRYD